VQLPLHEVEIGVEVEIAGLRIGHQADRLVLRTRLSVAVAVEYDAGPADPVLRPGPRDAVVGRARKLDSVVATPVSTQPTLFGPVRTLPGNIPAISSRAMCWGEYGTISLSWRLDRCLITMPP